MKLAPAKSAKSITSRSSNPNRRSRLSKDQWRMATAKFSTCIHQRARKLTRHLPQHIAANLYEDLVGVGFRGFVEAMHKLDPARKESSDAYVSQVITGAMLDELRRLDPLTRDQRRKQREIRTAERALTRSLGRAPSDEELARATGRGVDELRDLRAETNPITVSLDAPVKHEGDPMLSLVADRSSEDPFERTLAREKRHLVREAIDRLPHPQRTVLRRYYLEGSTLQTIGASMNVCAARASQIRKEAVTRLRRDLADRLAC